MKIRVLPDLVINQISAGEVVDRPASVVRELVDNAVDAGATDIAVTLEQGGHSFIKVSDNGCGMQRDDAILAFERHATSKIAQASDLDAISSLGFRGEALASIAAVAKVVLRTREAGSAVATEVVVEGGTLKGVRDVAGIPGTTIEVRALFYNTPARRKFLRQPKTEEQRVKQWLMSSALAHPAVRYRLVLDGEEVLVLPAARSSVERGREIFSGTSVEVQHAGPTLKVWGLVAHPSLAQAHDKALAILVNNRLVSDRMILRAVREGFDSTLKDREFPVGFVQIELPPADVDVNVHPQKSEVRFRDSHSVFRPVRDGVLQAVRNFRTPVFASAQSAGAWNEISNSPAFSRPMAVQESIAFLGSFAGREGSGESPPIHPPFRFADLKLVGQLLQCYLVCEFNDSLYMVDMHAAHERYNYNVIRNAMRERAVPSQQLLVPEVVELSPEGAAGCLEHQGTLEQFGFSFEGFGENSIVVRAAPSMLNPVAVREVIKEIAAVADDGEVSGRIEERFDHIAARIACHASIRSGEDMTRSEVYALFESLDRSEFSAACPHGRPVAVSFSLPEVERWFGRDR